MNDSKRLSKSPSIQKRLETGTSLPAPVNAAESLDSFKWLLLTY